MLEVLKSFDKDGFYEFYQKSELGKFITVVAPYINKRSYLKIENNGKISKKMHNYVIPLLAIINKENEREIIDYIFENCIDFSERIDIKKIDRLSNFSIEKLKKNLFKIFFNRDRSFALRYCKELYLRDEKEFFASLYRFSLMNDVSSRKALMVHSFRELIKKVDKTSDIDGLLFCVIDYIVNYETNLYIYQNVDYLENGGTQNEKGKIEFISYRKAITELGVYSNEDIDKYKKILSYQMNLRNETKLDQGFDQKAELILLNTMNKGE